MKRYLWTVLLALLLAGCAQDVEPDYIPTTSDNTAPTEISCYVKDSPVEQATGGAVMMYTLPADSYAWMESDSDKLLLASGEQKMKLTQGGGDSKGFFIQQTFSEHLNKALYRQPTANGVAFYDPEKHQVVFLRSGLQEYVVSVPQFDGDPVFSADGNLMYYCRNDEIRVLDLNSGIDRMLKSQTCKAQTLTGLYFQGDVLGCNITAEDDTVTTAFISAESGQSIAQNTGLHRIVTAGDAFVAFCEDGSVAQILAGNRRDKIQELLLPESENILPVPEIGGVLLYGLENGDDLVLDLYDITVGKHSASVTLTDVGIPKGICPDKNQNCVWILGVDPASGKEILYQWLPERSPVTDENSYAQPCYNAQNPDETGLTQLAAQADALAESHGIAIHIWNAAVEYPGDHTLIAEHQTKAIQQALQELETVLSTYPQDFLRNSTKQSLNISIVREISGAEAGLQYWDAGQAYIVLPIGCDYADAFAKGLGPVVISHILGNSSVFDNWESLNPSGFAYGQDPGGEMLSGSNRAFADSQAAESVTADRCQTFYYALCPENEAVFESETMQKKLRMLCQGIRDAWNWKKSQETFLWEQYLKEA